MFASFQTLYERLQEVSGDDSGTSTTGQERRFQEGINQTQSIVCAKKGGKWKFLEKTGTDTTVASQQAYPLLGDMRKVISLMVTVSTTDYPVWGIEDPELWNAVLAMNLGTSDVPLFWHQRGNDILIEPTPATASNTITYAYRKRVKEMRNDNYSIGNISAVTNGGTTVTGVDTLWTTTDNGQTGRFIRIRGTGDNQWYEIEDVVSATSITLEREYQGATISAGSEAYVIGEMPAIPPEYHDLLMWRPLAIYYSMHENPTLANHYWRMYDGGVEAGLSPVQTEGGLLGVMLEEERMSSESAIVSSSRELQERILGFNVNTPPSTTITFSDL